jgi:exodeoxyribonuclease-3
LRWLSDSQPDIVCLQELKAPDEKFPEKAIRDLGYDAIWHGQKSWNGVAILRRVGEIHETRRGLPGDPDDTHSRYIEAAINGILITGLYLRTAIPSEHKAGISQRSPRSITDTTSGPRYVPILYL